MRKMEDPPWLSWSNTRSGSQIRQHKAQTPFLFSLLGWNLTNCSEVELFSRKVSYLRHEQKPFLVQHAFSYFFNIFAWPLSSSLSARGFLAPCFECGQLATHFFAQSTWICEKTLLAYPEATRAAVAKAGNIQNRNHSWSACLAATWPLVVKVRSFRARFRSCDINRNHSCSPCWAKTWPNVLKMSCSRPKQAT